MAIAPFFERVVAAAGEHLSVTREALAGRLEDVVVTLSLGDQLGPNTRHLAALTTSLLARFYPRLSLTGPTEEIGPLQALARLINPAIELPASPGGDAWRISLDPAETGSGAVFVRADGWVATLGRSSLPGPPGPANPYSAGVAACLAASELFRRVFGLTTMQRDRYSVSVLDFSEGAGRELALGSARLSATALVGLGAVGQAAVWALSRHDGLGGDCWLVDDEKLELSNLQRYVLSMIGDVGVLKTDLAARELTPLSGLTIHKEPATLATFAEGFGGEFPIEVIAISVDNVEGRRAAQALLPRIVVSAYTGDGSIGVSAHRVVEDEACLACLYQPRGPSPSHADLVGQAFGISAQRAALLLAADAPLDEPELAAIAKKYELDMAATEAWRNKPLRALYIEQVCGGGLVPVAGRGASQVVPLAHQSALAGVLLAAELVKRATPALASSTPLGSIAAWHDLRRAPPRRWVEPRAPAAGCLCRDSDYRDAYSQKWNNLRSTPAT